MEIVWHGYNIVELAKMALEKPEDFGWWGNEEMFISWGWAGIDKSNASDALELSNFEVVSNDLLEKFPKDFELVGLGHWVVGHADRFIVRILNDSNSEITEDNITDAFKYAMEWKSKLDEYPIADEDHFYDFCVAEVIEWMNSDLPQEIFIRESKEKTIDEIYGKMIEDELLDPMFFCLDGIGPSEYTLLYVAYDLSLCDANYIDFWDEFALEQGLPAIHWGDNYGASSNRVHQLEGQLSLFEEGD
jgi:hypothetical protein